MPLLFSLTMLFLELACTGETSENCELYVSAICLSLGKLVRVLLRCWSS